MKKLFLGLAFVSLGAPSFANGGNNEWTLLSTDQNVSVYYEHGTCRNQEVLFVRIVNNNSSTTNVSWTLWEGAQTKTLEVKAGETVTGSCQNRQPMFILTENIPAGKTEKDLQATVHVTIKQ